ncbi:SWIM zinc finger family protein [Pyrococcus yayanosii]|uniref:Zinc finger SWIM domain protein n=1 Tax=Pyrococcus yayanosii (strain CH1 / JCM 16557) TaxID=529709 RepID=F8AJ89_PYRYC|nr:SWIM zinc finger family protein [Pyrococcus yayanosii]AEH24530.1 zinc finger SWIM domain protein [Pyrococcus yayanosii CH1]
MARVSWVVKSGKRLYGRVLGTYAYLVVIDLGTGQGMCTCPRGGNCKHVMAVLWEYERGNYIEADANLITAEAEVWRFAAENREFGKEIILREIGHALKTDESGSRVGELFLKALEMLDGDETFRLRLSMLFEEFERIFYDHAITGIIASRLRGSPEGSSP